MSSAARVKLADGSTLGVEVDDVTVDLVHRHPSGDVALGLMLTPQEARRLGWALIAGAATTEAP